MSWPRDWLTWLAMCAAVTVSNVESSSVSEVPDTLRVTAGNTSVRGDESISVDPNGYVLFCPCMGE